MLGKIYPPLSNTGGGAWSDKDSISAYQNGAWVEKWSSSLKGSLSSRYSSKMDETYTSIKNDEKTIHFYCGSTTDVSDYVFIEIPYKWSTADGDRLTLSYWVDVYGEVYDYESGEYYFSSYPVDIYHRVSSTSSTFNYIYPYTSKDTINALEWEQQNVVVCAPGTGRLYTDYVVLQLQFRSPANEHMLTDHNGGGVRVSISDMWLDEKRVLFDESLIVNTLPFLDNMFGN